MSTNYGLLPISIARAAPWNRAGAMFQRGGTRPFNRQRGDSRLEESLQERFQERGFHYSQLGSPRTGVTTDLQHTLFRSGWGGVQRYVIAHNVCPSADQVSLGERHLPSHRVLQGPKRFSHRTWVAVVRKRKGSLARCFT